MSEEDKKPGKNPLVFPDSEPQKRRGCPKCGCPDFGGRKVMGVITFTCLKCKTKWTGGLPQEPQDPSIPLPPMNPADKPDLEFFRDGKKDEISEVRNPRNPTQSFRRGALVPEDGDE